MGGFSPSFFRIMAKRKLMEIPTDEEILLLAAEREKSSKVKSKITSEYSSDGKTILQKPRPFSDADKGKRKIAIKEKGMILEKEEINSMAFCEVCQDFKPKSVMFFMDRCNHSYCNDCICGHVAEMFKQDILRVNCPIKNCNVELKPRCLRGVLPKEVVLRWANVRRGEYPIIDLTI